MSKTPSLIGIKKAAKVQIPTLTARISTRMRIGWIEGVAHWVTKVFSPEARGRREILKGELPDVAALLVAKLMETKLINNRDNTFGMMEYWISN